jgi:hypothetical protein
MAGCAARGLRSSDLRAYFAIPVAIWTFVSKRPNIEMRGLARLFAAFILWCGLTHIVNLVTLWWPIYEFQALVKVVTAAISLTTAVVIFPLIPKALAIPSPNELQLANAHLAKEIAAHKQRRWSRPEPGSSIGSRPAPRSCARQRNGSGRCLSTRPWQC